MPLYIILCGDAVPYYKERVWGPRLIWREVAYTTAECPHRCICRVRVANGTTHKPTIVGRAEVAAGVRFVTRRSRDLSTLFQSERSVGAFVRVCSRLL